MALRGPSGAAQTHLPEGSLRILIVDDDPGMARTLASIFRIKGYQAAVAHNGLDALRQVTGACFDCVLSDIRMPEMNGVELCRAMQGSQPGVPVLLMTAYSQDTLVSQGLDEGAVAVLSKPLDIDGLLTFVSSLPYSCVS
jgi:two-component system response regulator HydG